MSFQSRIPSPSKSKETSQGDRPAVVAKKLPKLQFQSRLKQDDLDVPKPGTFAVSAGPPRFEEVRATKVAGSGPGKNVAAHTRSHSTNATLKQPAGTQVSSQASTARIPGKNLDRTQTPATSAQHRRNLSALTSTRVARPEQSANWPKARPVCGVPKDHASTASLNGTTLTRPIFDNSKQLSIPQKAKQSISVANSTLSTNLNAEGVGGSDFSRIGDELLQLSLLHESSASTFQQYTNSVINHLKDQHAGLEIQHQQLESRERDRQTQVNLRGIRKWFDQNSGSSDVSLNPLSLLAECTHELEDLSKGDGDFSAAMKQFDDWKLGADIAMTSCGTSEETEVRFVVPISPDWRNLIMSLDTKLKMYMNTLRDFRKGNESTAIDEMITMLSVLGQSLLQEIEICKTLEGLILQRQQRWIDSSIEKALLAVRADSSQAFQLTVRKGIWEDIEDQGWTKDTKLRSEGGC